MKNRTTLLFGIQMFCAQNPYMEVALYSYIHRWWKGVVVVRITTNFSRRPRPPDTPHLWRGPHISVPLSPHYRCASVSTSYLYFHPHNHLSPFHKHTFTITYSPFYNHTITYHPFTLTPSPPYIHLPITTHHHTHTPPHMVMYGWSFFTPKSETSLHVLHYPYSPHLL